MRFILRVLIPTIILSACKPTNYSIYTNPWYILPTPKNIKAINIIRYTPRNYDPNGIPFKIDTLKINYNKNGQISSIDGTIFKYSLSGRLKKIVYADTLNKLLAGKVQSKFKYKIGKSNPNKRINYNWRSGEVSDTEDYYFDRDSLHLTWITHYKTGEVKSIFDHYFTPELFPVKKIERTFSYSNGKMDFEQRFCKDYIYHNDSLTNTKRIEVYVCGHHDRGSRPIVLDASLKIIKDSTFYENLKFEYEFYE